MLQDLSHPVRKHRVPLPYSRAGAAYYWLAADVDAGSTNTPRTSCGGGRDGDTNS